MLFDFSTKHFNIMMTAEIPLASSVYFLLVSLFNHDTEGFVRI